MLRAVLCTLAALTGACLSVAPSASAITLQPGFEDVPQVTGLPSGTDSIAFAPDGRTFIGNAGSGGTIHVVAPGATTASKTINLTGNIYGIALDRDFATNGYLYAIRTHGGNTTQRLVRVTVKADSTLENPTNPQTVLLGSGTANPCPAPSNTNDCITANSPHDFNTVRSDPRDGTLWVSNGDGSNVGGPGAFQAQDPVSLHGKLLHIDRNGKGLPGHPFCPSDTDLSHNCTKIGAIGFRNPFRFHMRPNGGPVVGDVGWATREEIDFVTPGKNYGWPCYEGLLRTSNYRDDARCAALYAKEGTADAATPPIHTYGRTSAGASITGGPVFGNGSYPAGYAGEHLLRRLRAGRPSSAWR